MTVCNMSIEAGGRAGMVAPDETTFEYLRGREHAPQGDEFDAAALIHQRVGCHLAREQVAHLRQGTLANDANLIGLVLAQVLYWFSNRVPVK